MKSNLKSFPYFVLLLLILCPVVTHAAIINVPSATAPTIQAGIGFAVNGDTVLVANGIYTGVGNSNIDFMGKAITVKSQGGSANCTIDAAGALRGVWFHRGETAASVLAGFKIINGNAGIIDGGGILCELLSSPTIQDCVITLNKATTGGGIACMGSSPKILNCIIEANSALASGGGIVCDLGAAPVITNCTINKNTSTIDGGGISIDNGSMPAISNCQVSFNNAGTTGGGIAIGLTAAPTIVNCVIASNTSVLSGGGIDSGFGSSTITNCTITLNKSGIGGGINSESAKDTLTNCILWGDFPTETSAALSTLTITHSDIQGGFVGMGNLLADPKFMNPLTGDYHLKAGSPCINMGNNLAPALPATDKDGKPRIAGGTVDMGAYEF
jgi:hypothetical protein